jgi:hypothetical protein
MAITASVTPGFTYSTGIELEPAGLNLLGTPTVTIDSISATSVRLENFTVSNAPSNGTAGRVIYVSDGDGGSPCLAVDNGSNWLRINLGSAVSATDADDYLLGE